MLILDMVGNVSETGEGRVTCCPFGTSRRYFCLLRRSLGVGCFFFVSLFLYMPLSFRKASGLILWVGAQILIQMNCVAKNVVV